MPEKITAQVGDKQITIETGKLAKQADGAVTVQLGETIVIVAAGAATKAKEGQEAPDHWNRHRCGSVYRSG